MPSTGLIVFAVAVAVLAAGGAVAGIIWLEREDTTPVVHHTEILGVSIIPSDPRTTVRVNRVNLFRQPWQDVSNYDEQALLPLGADPQDTLTHILGVSGRTLYLQLYPNDGCETWVHVEFADHRQLVVPVPNREHGKGLFIDLVTGEKTAQGLSFHSELEGVPDRASEFCQALAQRRVPTMSPTIRPTHFPTKFPTHLPSHSPTARPTMSPTASPTVTWTVYEGRSCRAIKHSYWSEPIEYCKRQCSFYLNCVAFDYDAAVGQCRTYETCAEMVYSTKTLYVQAPLVPVLYTFQPTPAPTRAVTERPTTRAPTTMAPTSTTRSPTITATLSPTRSPSLPPVSQTFQTMNNYRCERDPATSTEHAGVITVDLCQHGCATALTCIAYSYHPTTQLCVHHTMCLHLSRDNGDGVLGYSEDYAVKMMPMQTRTDQGEFWWHRCSDVIRREDVWMFNCAKNCEEMNHCQYVVRESGAAGTPRVGCAYCRAVQPILLADTEAKHKPALKKVLVPLSAWSLPDIGYSPVHRAYTSFSIMGVDHLPGCTENMLGDRRRLRDFSNFATPGTCRKYCTDRTPHCLTSTWFQRLNEEFGEACMPCGHPDRFIPTSSVGSPETAEALTLYVIESDPPIPYAPRTYSPTSEVKTLAPTTPRPTTLAPTTASPTTETPAPVPTQSPTPPLATYPPTTDYSFYYYQQECTGVPYRTEQVMTSYCNFLCSNDARCLAWTAAFTADVTTCDLINTCEALQASSRHTHAKYALPYI